MEKVILIIKADNNGRYKTVEVLKQIKASCQGIVFPDKDINKTSLSEVVYHGKQCISGNTEGISGTFNNSTYEYMERKIELIFA